MERPYLYEMSNNQKIAIFSYGVAEAGKKVTVFKIAADFENFSKDFNSGDDTYTVESYDRKIYENEVIYSVYKVSKNNKLQDVIIKKSTVSINPNGGTSRTRGIVRSKGPKKVEDPVEKYSQEFEGIDVSIANGCN
jgi:hypothetical protein